MFDFQLQMRFMKSAMDAWFGYAAAGAAAIEALQDEAQRNFTAKAPAPQLSLFDTSTNPFAWWTEAFLNAGGATQRSPAADFAAPFFQFGALPFAQFGTFPFAGFGFGMQPQRAWQNGWTDMMQTCCWSWPQVSWSLYQPPMTAMLMSAGLPFSVAAPTAQANAATLDAADAARQSFDKMYSSFQTSGGHAFVPLMLWQKMLVLLATQWLAAMPQVSGAAKLL